ncbi:hypothetical protein PR048_020625 [Dryococelus australis]|uniref:Uncharacterized protein n=1 Tax=Dryococelus australis TaxID=614101 RepID=A0ABQ9H6W2_9NEOP|nr:hypothetical protein PR048_020625 [Dryococelus australis]
MHAGPNNPASRGGVGALGMKHTALFHRQGTAVAEWLACSPPTKANRVQPSAGSLPNFHKLRSYRTMPLVGGFSRGSPVSLHSGTAPISPQFTLIGSQNLFVANPPKSLNSTTAALEQWLSRLPSFQSNLAVYRMFGNPFALTLDLVSLDRHTREPCNELSSILPVNKMIASPLKVPRVQASQRELCSLVQSIALSGDVAHRERSRVALSLPHFSATNTENRPRGRRREASTPTKAQLTTAGTSSLQHHCVQASQKKKKKGERCNELGNLAVIRWNEGAWETGVPRKKNPPTRGIVRRDSHMRNSGSDHVGNRTRWEASWLTTTPPRSQKY